jgi:phenylpyruvate tautomerase PptA (4-oxalocrotonate tautomerase family)
MPLVRIYLPDTTSDEECSAISQIVHQALVDTFNVPMPDRFQILTRRTPHELICSEEFLGVRHSAHVAFIQIFCAPGRSLEMKKALFSETARQASSQCSFSAADVIINLVETPRENWSFGNGLMQYSP